MTKAVFIDYTGTMVQEDEPGITPIYLSRRGKTELDGVRVITSLDEI